MESPNVVIVGGGPGGFLTAILLSQQSIPTTVLERASAPDEWSTKSYTIQIAERGQNALTKAGLLDKVKECGMVRDGAIAMDAHSGKQMRLPSRGGVKGVGTSRPILIKCLEKVAKEDPNITILRDSGVSKISKLPSGSLEVSFEDKDPILASHVIGADGKWSRVRKSLKELDEQFEIVEEPSFAVHFMVDSLNEANIPSDGTLFVKPTDPNAKFHIIAGPVPTGEVSVSLVCYDETLESCPWLEPPSSTPTKGWEAEYSAMAAGQLADESLSKNMAAMLKEHAPAFLELVGEKSLESSRVNRRISWVKAVDSENVSYSTKDGSVALLGDAAHAVTPTLGGGCSESLESAVDLADAVRDAIAESPQAQVTQASLSAAFLHYGRSRPKQVVPRQLQSAELSQWKNSLKFGKK